MPREGHPAAARIHRQCLGMPLRLLHRAVNAVYDDALRGHGLGLAQLNLLVAVERAGEHATPSVLSRVLHLEKSSLSRDIDRLEARGWVARVDVDDARSHRLALTAAGAALLHEVLPSWEQAQARVRALLGAEGSRALAQLAERVREVGDPGEGKGAGRAARRR